MRCADFGPTPGRHRSASIRSSTAVSPFIPTESLKGEGVRGADSRSLAATLHSFTQSLPHLKRQFHPRGQSQPTGDASHLFLNRGFHLAGGVVHRRGDQILEHFLVLTDQGGIDVHSPDVVLAGHHHLDHAGARLAFDLDRGELLLKLAHVVLHLLGLLHQPGELRFHGHPRYCVGLIDDSTTVASKVSTRSRTNPSWAIAAMARPRAESPPVLPILTVSRRGFPKCS